MAFRIGQKVCCVDDDFAGRDIDTYGIITPRKGGVYTIREILDFHGAANIRLEEIVNRPISFGGYVQTEVAFATTRFRPVTEQKHTTSISIFKEILDRENHGLPSRVDYPADCEPK